MKKVLFVLLLGLLLTGMGMLLYRCFVTDRISDWGGMENPEYSQGFCLPDIQGQDRA